ncbi:MAG: DUF3179 domain-containing protein [Pseudomonadota bacterium]
MAPSPLSRRALLTVVAGGAAFAGWPAAAWAQDRVFIPIEAQLQALVSRNPKAFLDALKFFSDNASPEFAPHMVLAMRFSSAPAQIFDGVMERMTGEKRSGWFDWMLWQEAHPEVVPHESYYDFKRQIFLSIDPNFEVFLKPAAVRPDAAKIRFEEVTWGGVRKDGIPSLDNPELTPAADADYLLDTDLVFGVAINGDARAYPLRIMGWHEMFNEVIGGVPLALAYCTLCGSGILFETDVDGRDAPFVFGSSGFLYRSNKLMFDRETHTLWNQFTGKPVIGELVGSGIALKQRPVVITTWAKWKADNPNTKVLALNTGHRRDYGSGVVYKDYFASPDLMFPTATDPARLAPKDYVFGIRDVGASKAWPLAAFAAEPVINDRVGGLNVVLMGDPDGRTVRAYERDELTFDDAMSADGRSWIVAEEELVGPDGERLPRVAGHIAYWFAWDGYLGAQSALYGAE